MLGDSDTSVRRLKAHLNRQLTLQAREGGWMTKFTAAIQKPLILRCPDFVTFSSYL